MVACNICGKETDAIDVRIPAFLDNNGRRIPETYLTVCSELCMEACNAEVED